MHKNWIIPVAIGIFFSLVLAFYLRLEIRDNNFSEKRKRAFLNSHWGMSQAEVASENNKQLRNVNVDLRGGRDSDTPHLFITNINRFKNRIDNNLQLWGHDGAVNYWFFDDNLFKFEITISGFNSEQLDSLIVSNISKKHEMITSVPKTNLNYEYEEYWESEFEIIHYWMLPPRVLLKKEYNVELYIGKIRVTYKPLLELIEGISSEEHENIF